MHRRFAVSALVALLAVPAVLTAQHRAPAAAPGTPGVTVIYGTLLGADGAPMKLAHVHLWRGLSSRTASRSVVGPDGHYAIATPDTGPLGLQFTGVDHSATTVRLVVDRPQTIALDVRLARYEYADSLGSVTAIGDWNHFAFGSAEPLVKQPDGRYSLVVEATADTLAYELMGVTKGEGHSINGTQAGRYEYDNGGDYRSVIPAKDGHATIVFDPAALNRTPGKESVAFRDGTTMVAHAWRLMHAWSDEESAYFDSSAAARKRHDSLHYDLKPAVARLRAALRAERAPVVRQMLLFTLMDATSLAGTSDTAVARDLIAQVPPSSPWYGALPNALNSTYTAYRLVYGHPAAKGTPPDTSFQRKLMERNDRILAAQLDSDLQVEIIATQVFLARSLHDDARMNDYYTRLVTNYPNSGEVAFLKSQLAPNRVFQVGAQVPDFQFPGVDDSTITYSRASMAGKTYLLDFWATWCGPCIGEMPYLQAAHDSLAAQGIEFLSVSLDQKADDVRHFRQGEWKMPWAQAFAAGGFENAQIKKLEVFGIPHTALIGKDGRILAVDVRGESLTADIRHALAPPATP